MVSTHFDSNLVNRDEEHLRLLSVYHLLFAGIVALFLILFTLLPLVIGPAYFHTFKLPPAPPEQLMAGLFIGALYALVLALNGWSLKQRRHRITCILLSCAECLNVPIGMILGVSAILVLRRDTVRELFRSAREG